MEKRTSGRYSTNQGASCKTIDALMHGNYGRSSFTPTKIYSDNQKTL